MTSRKSNNPLLPARASMRRAAKDKAILKVGGNSALRTADTNAAPTGVDPKTSASEETLSAPTTVTEPATATTTTKKSKAKKVKTAAEGKAASGDKANAAASLEELDGVRKTVATQSVPVKPALERNVAAESSEVVGGVEKTVVTQSAPMKSAIKSSRKVVVKQPTPQAASPDNGKVGDPIVAHTKKRARGEASASASALGGPWFLEGKKSISIAKPASGKEEGGAVESCTAKKPASWDRSSLPSPNPLKTKVLMSVAFTETAVDEEEEGSGERRPAKKKRAVQKPAFVAGPSQPPQSPSERQVKQTAAFVDPVFKPTSPLPTLSSPSAHVGDENYMEKEDDESPSVGGEDVGIADPKKGSYVKPKPYTEEEETWLKKYVESNYPEVKGRQWTVIHTAFNAKFGPERNKTLPSLSVKYSHMVGSHPDPFNKKAAAATGGKTMAPTLSARAKGKLPAYAVDRDLRSEAKDVAPKGTKRKAGGEPTKPPGPKKITPVIEDGTRKRYTEDQEKWLFGHVLQAFDAKGLPREWKKVAMAYLAKFNQRRKPNMLQQKFDDLARPMGIVGVISGRKAKSAAEKGVSAGKAADHGPKDGGDGGENVQQREDEEEDAESDYDEDAVLPVTHVAPEEEEVISYDDDHSFESQERGGPIGYVLVLGGTHATLDDIPGLQQWMVVSAEGETSWLLSHQIGGISRAYRPGGDFLSASEGFRLEWLALDRPFGAELDEKDDGVDLEAEFAASEDETSSLSSA